MINDHNNVGRIHRRVGRYLTVDDSDFIKVAHRACMDYNDDEIEEAIAYVDDMLTDHPRRIPAPEQRLVATRLPDDQLIAVGGITVRILGRAYEHIPPKYWKQFAGWIAGGSLGATIKEYGEKVRSWYQVSLVSDEALGSEQIVIVCSFNNFPEELIIYHAQPNIYNYANFVRK